MSDTTHSTIAELLATLPAKAPYTQDTDGAADVVDAQTLRDMAVSLSSQSSSAIYGQLSIQAQTAGQVTGIDTYEPLEGWDTEGPTATGISVSSANGRITFTDACTAMVMFTLSYSAASAAIVTFSFSVDGTEAGPEFTRTHSNADTGSVSGMFVSAISAGSYVDVHVKTAAAETLTYEGGSFVGQCLS